MKIVYADAFKAEAKRIEQILSEFSEQGKVLSDGRNTIKTFDLNGREVNVKSFRVPNLINMFVYRFFRKSKAERSFNYAEYLLSREIGTPFPVAYAEECHWLTFGRSYYISDHLEYDFTFRDIEKIEDTEKYESVLRAFTRFTYDLHEKNIEFLDHSPGNTLIQVDGDHFNFFLVDLNRMNFKQLDFKQRMKNFSRLTPKKEMIQIMANEYSILTAWNEHEVFETMWGFTEEFQEKFYRKKRLKKQLKFWKN
ncbi:lipopolysaccharide kinase InaA family protein [Zunongwangia endophytica]|uniref:Lipopolysaccharide kinase InaA family protein n=1 Tax=Zunongwangia endophytica TaxID=1808945 RepID=A0ABV8HBR2_9FLAO|nr:lipopolysaccharide kinase InaA family protein [Zunongwangia endophytica]MDN3593375.1 lipopolysaccharide kinase InaA family protein [Zunongwangia endophytica]